jgi:hypothetical protein
MTTNDPRGWLDKAVGACLSILVGAAALFFAVKLIEQIFTALVIMFTIVLIVVVVIAIIRWRSQGW